MIPFQCEKFTRAVRRIAFLRLGKTNLTGFSAIIAACAGAFVFSANAPKSLENYALLSALIATTGMVCSVAFLVLGNSHDHQNIDQLGLAGPTTTIKKYPERLEAFEELTDSVLAHGCNVKSEEFRCAGELVLKGAISPQDVHFAVTAVRLGISTKKDMLSAIEDMRDRPALLTSGML